MFRKPMLLMLAAASVSLAALSLAASAPVRAADLDGWQPGPRGVWGPRFYNGVPLSYGYGLCYRRELLLTPWGPRWRLVNRCY